MVSCICSRCSDGPGFKDYIECESCGEYGNRDDDFADDPDKEFCDECYADWLRCTRGSQT